jgi:polysaccharide pyruvyl transferase WcaK-like protein
MGFPYHIARWTYLCRINGIKVAVASAGAGPLDAWLSKQLIKNSLNRFTYRSFRDEMSKGLIDDLGVSGDTYVCPDLAFSVPVPDGAERASDGYRKDVAIVGLPFRKPGHWENPDQGIYGQYLNSLAEFASWLLQAGYTVRLVTTHVRTDSIFVNDLKSLCRFRGLKAAGRLIEEPAESFEQIMAQLSEAEIVVASRFHGVVFSYLLGRPVLGISYHPKVRTLMKNFGQEEFCVELPTLDVKDLKTRFLLLEFNQARARKHIQETVSVYRDALEEQYQKLLNL